MADFVYPTSAEIFKISQSKIPRLTKDRPAFKFFPMVNKKVDTILWEQRDNYQGLQQVRGMEGQPSRVKRIGAKRYSMEPGVYGEFIPLEERELTKRRAFGTMGSKMDIGDMVMEAEEQLTQRFLDRVEVTIWSLISTGAFTVVSPQTGATLHTDVFPINTFSAIVPWSTYATATPLADLRQVKLLSRGTSNSFDSGSELYINQVTLNHLLSNRNANDVAGRRVGGLLTPLTLEEINKIFTGEGLPSIVVYDEGYYNDAGTFTLFVPDNTFTLIGRRPAGQTVGEYIMSINANNPGAAPGRYMRVKNKAKGDNEAEIPPVIEVHDGHNGGPAIYFPGAVVKGNV